MPRKFGLRFRHVITFALRLIQDAALGLQGVRRTQFGVPFHNTCAFMGCTC